MNVKIVVRNSKFSLFWLFILQQTNTADMLDLAVEYIKDLQKQVKVLYKLLSVHQNHMKLFLFLLSVEKKSHMNLQLLLSSLTKSLSFSCRHSRIQRQSARVQVNRSNIQIILPNFFLYRVLGARQSNQECNTDFSFSNSLKYNKMLGDCGCDKYVSSYFLCKKKIQ